MIYHVTTADSWIAQESASSYSASSLAAEGFIHCSTQTQLAGVLLRYYSGVQNLLVLHIDEARLANPCSYEPATGGELFPHVYGPINKDAITAVQPIESP